MDISAAAVNRLLTSPESSDAKMESLGMRKLLPDAILLLGQDGPQFTHSSS